MNDMQIARFDERDSGWELSTPRFMVYLHGSGETSTPGWKDTYDITGAPVSSRSSIGLNGKPARR